MHGLIYTNTIIYVNEKKEKSERDWDLWKRKKLLAIESSAQLRTVPESIGFLITKRRFEDVREWKKIARSFNSFLSTSLCYSLFLSN